MHYERLSSRFLAIQIIWCQLLLYSGFVVFSFYYRLSFAKLKASNEQLQQLNISKSNFLSTIGHEIRTPLSAIIGSAEMLLKSGHSEDAGYSKIIISCATSLLQCMNDMLQFIGLEQRKMNPTASQNDVQHTEFNVRTLIKEVLDIAALPAIINDELQVSNSFNIADGEIMVKGNYMHTKTVLLNLVSNAIKFTPRGKVSINVIVHDNNCAFEIKDTGIGITEAFKTRIFQPFAQQDATIRQRFGGTGLGLSICKTLADSMNATLTFTSEENVGSTFIFTVPLARIGIPEMNRNVTSPVTPRSKVPYPCQCTEKRTKHVLVVDDNPINIKVMNKMIESCGVMCTGVLSGKEALSLLEKKYFDMVFLDLQMPEMTGIQCAQYIRNKFHPSPIIYLVTGADMSSVPEDQKYLVDNSTLR